MILFYTKSYQPNERERAAIEGLDSPSLRNAKFFRGQTEPADLVVSAADHVIEAYDGLCEVRHLSEGQELPKVSHEKRKGGWVWIFVDGEKVDSVRPDDLEEALKEWRRTSTQPKDTT